MTGQLNMFTKTAVTPEREAEKSIPRWEINRQAEGYKWVIDQNWRHMAKIGFLDQKSRFWAQKKTHFWRTGGLEETMFWPRPEKVVQRKKLPLPK